MAKRFLLLRWLLGLAVASAFLAFSISSGPAVLNQDRKEVTGSLNPGVYLVHVHHPS